MTDRQGNSCPPPERNRSAAARYRTLLETLIADWRRQWGADDLPFYYVQIAPFQYGNEDPTILAEFGLNVPDTMTGGSVFESPSSVSRSDGQRVNLQERWPARQE